MLLEKAVLERVGARVREMVNTAINDQVLLKLLAGVEQYSELPFVFNGGTYTLRGRIDKLFKHRERNGWAILDWKSREPRDSEPVSFAREHYFDLQLACYRMVIEKLKKTKVKGLYLYFTSLGKLVEITYNGDPSEEIDDLSGFIEEYKADPGPLGERIKAIKKDSGECTTCSYSMMGVC